MWEGAALPWSGVEGEESVFLRSHGLVLWFLQVLGTSMLAPLLRYLSFFFFLFLSCFPSCRLSSLLLGRKSVLLVNVFPALWVSIEHHGTVVLRLIRARS